MEDDPAQYEVVWSLRSRNDLLSAYRYIEAFAPNAARRFGARLEAVVATLTTHPLRGRNVGGERRQLTVMRPYLITYEVNGGVVQVLFIRHGAREDA